MAAFALPACGDSDEGDGNGNGNQRLSVTLSGKGKAAEFKAPKSAEAGVAEITFTNKSEKPADMQLIRVEGDHSPAEVVRCLGKAIRGKPFEDWFFAGGGVSPTKPGQSGSVTQVLAPGTYFVFNSESDGPPDPSSAGRIEVTGEASEEELEADTEIVADDARKEYRFKTSSPLHAGKQEILFRNAGAQPHHLLISMIKGDASDEDIEKAFKADKAPPPLIEKGSQATAVLEGKEAQLVTLDLKPGRYAFYCFVSDREGGKPHALKGMVEEFKVK